MHRGRWVNICAKLQSELVLYHQFWLSLDSILLYSCSFQNHCLNTKLKLFTTVLVNVPAPNKMGPFSVKYSWAINDIEYVHAYQTVFLHDDIITWKCSLHYCPFVWGIHWSPIPHTKGQWCRALMFPLMPAWTNSLTNNWEAVNWDSLVLISCHCNVKMANEISWGLSALQDKHSPTANIQSHLLFHNENSWSSACYKAIYQLDLCDMSADYFDFYSQDARNLTSLC